MILLAVASLSLIALTVAVNLLANFVAPIYALVNLFPRHLNFRRAGLVSAVVGLVIPPWNLYNSPVVVNYFLGGLGALLGPLFGVIMADYWLLRKSRVNVPDLYTDDAGASTTTDAATTRGPSPRSCPARPSPSSSRWSPPSTPGRVLLVHRRVVAAALYCVVADRAGRTGRGRRGHRRGREPPAPARRPTMRILVVNVNTTPSITDTIGAQAAAAASPGTEIVPLTPPFGAESVEGNYESYLAAVAVMEAVRSSRAVRRGDPGRLRRARPRRAARTARRPGRRHHRSRREHRSVPRPPLLRGHHPRPYGPADRGRLRWRVSPPGAPRCAPAGCRTRPGTGRGGRRGSHRRTGRPGGRRGPGRGDLPGLRRHAADRTRRRAHRGPRGRRRHGRRDDRRVPRPPRPVHVQGAHLRPAPAQRIVNWPP